MAPTRRQLEDELVAISLRLHARGWVANHDGNVSVRLGEGRILATPTGVSKAGVDRQCLIVVDGEGNVISGRHKPFSELGLHLFVYRHRPDVNAVLHSHAPHATALATCGIPVEPKMMAEPVVSLGDTVPLVPYAPPKSPEATFHLAPIVGIVDSVTLENHCVLTWGPDLETAYLRMELVEHLARIQTIAQSLGGARTIPEGDISKLLQARAAAGLGPGGRPEKPEAAAGSVSRTTREVIRREVGQAVRQR